MRSLSFRKVELHQNAGGRGPPPCARSGRGGGRSTLLVSPSAMSASTSRSRSVRAPSASRSPADEGRATTCGSRADLPFARAGSLEELVDVEDPVLQEVAEAPGRDEVDRAGGLDVLGQDEYADLGVRPRGSSVPRVCPRPLKVGGIRMSTTARSGVCSATPARRRSALSTACDHLVPAAGRRAG